MTLAPTLQKHLDQNVTYEVITHDPTMSSTRTAQACHVSGDCLAKAIVLRRDGGYMLAVLPASHHIRTVSSARFPPSANATIST
jgi:Ala-tRNA(Pro) deacylase